MIVRHIALAFAALCVVGCGSGATANETTTTTSASPAAVSSPQSTAITSTSSTTKVTPTLDQPTVEVCRAAANELDRNDLGRDLKAAIAADSLSPIAFATKTEKYRAIDAGAAVPAVGTAVNDFNDLTLELGDTLFVDWKQDKVQDWTAAYKKLVTACKTAGSAI